LATGGSVTLNYNTTLKPAEQRNGQQCPDPRSPMGTNVIIGQSSTINVNNNGANNKQTRSRSANLTLGDKHAHGHKWK